MKLRNAGSLVDFMAHRDFSFDCLPAINVGRFANLLQEPRLWFPFCSWSCQFFQLLVHPVVAAEQSLSRNPFRRVR
jgi:hypothetical protein